MNENEKIIGTMCLMDNNYYWCSYSEQIISAVINQWDILTILADNDIHVDFGCCEFDSHCFNMDCEYNTCKDAGYVLENTDYIKWNDEAVTNVQKSFMDMTNILRDDKDTLQLLNKSAVVTSGYEWTIKK